MLVLFIQVSNLAWRVSKYLLGARQSVLELLPIVYVVLPAAAEVVIPVLLEKQAKMGSSSCSWHSYVTCSRDLERWFLATGPAAFLHHPGQGAPSRVFWGALHVEEASVMFWGARQPLHDASDTEPRAAQKPRARSFGISQPSLGALLPLSVFLGLRFNFKQKCSGAGSCSFKSSTCPSWVLWLTHSLRGPALCGTKLYLCVSCEPMSVVRGSRDLQLLKGFSNVQCHSLCVFNQLMH